MSNQKKKDKKPKRNFPIWNLLFYPSVISLIVLSLFFDFELPKTEKPEKINFFELTEIIKKEAESKKPEKIKIAEMAEGKVIVTIGDEGKSKQYETDVNPRESSLSNILKTYNVEYEFVMPTKLLGLFFNILFYGFLILILWVMVIPMLKSRNFGGAGKKIKTKSNITFDDIGGLSDETKKEILQTQELIKHPTRAKKLGIKPSKGIILYGPSGTGKTLIAKAVANSFNAEFISTSGSEFVELFAGMGAKKVRDMFEKAKKNAPAVIFIDEIDAVGKKRSSNGAYSNDEREQTLNQILVNLDGVEEMKDVLVIAATNRLDMLDDALLRPGRFDYKIKIDLPDAQGRKEIIAIHTKNKPLSQEVHDRLDEIAESTVGCSGADLESLFDNAAYHSFGQGRDEITMEDVNIGLDRMIIGSATRSIKDIETKRRVAFHEAGHAVVSSILNPNSVRKATIVPRGQALGYVAQIPKEGLHDKNELINMLKVMVAGGVAETLVFQTHSTGVSDDFKRAKELVGKMIEDWGMGKTSLVPSFSEKEKQGEMKSLYEAIVKDTVLLIKNNRSLFEKVAELLLSKETIDGKEIELLKEQFVNELPVEEEVSEVKLDNEELTNEAIVKEQFAKEQGAREQLVRDQLAQEQSAREAIVKEQLIKEQVAREELVMKQFAKEQLDREERIKDQLIQEQLAREELVKEQFTKEQIAREELIKEQLVQEQLVREQLVKEQFAQEQLAREELIKEQLVQEQLAREELVREQFAQEQLAREELVREQLAKEQLIREELVKDQLAEEQLVREELVKGQLVEEQLVREELVKGQLVEEQLVREELTRDDLPKDDLDKLALAQSIIKARMNSTQEFVSKEQLAKEKLAKEKLELAQAIIKERMNSTQTIISKGLNNSPPTKKD